MLCEIDYRNNNNVLVLSTKTSTHGGELETSILAIKPPRSRVRNFSMSISTEVLMKMGSSQLLGRWAFGSVRNSGIKIFLSFLAKMLSME